MRLFGKTIWKKHSDTIEIVADSYRVETDDPVPFRLRTFDNAEWDIDYLENVMEQGRPLETMLEDAQQYMRDFKTEDDIEKELLSYVRENWTRLDMDAYHKQHLKNGIYVGYPYPVKPVLTKSGEEKVHAFILTCTNARKTITDSHLDTVEDTELPDVEDILADIPYFIDNDGYSNCWGVTDHQNRLLALIEDEDFIMEKKEGEV